MYQETVKNSLTIVYEKIPLCGRFRSDYGLGRIEIRQGTERDFTFHQHMLLKVLKQGQLKTLQDC